MTDRQHDYLTQRWQRWVREYHRRLSITDPNRCACPICMAEAQERLYGEDLIDPEELQTALSTFATWATSRGVHPPELGPA